MLPVLLDTGPFVALLDRSDGAHERCVRAFELFESPLLTTEAVLTETLHLLRKPRAQDAALAFVQSGAVEIVPYARDAFDRARALMKKYADVPMDYADATLVRLAEEMEIDRVLTLDRRGFRAYRRHGRTPFVLLP